MEKEQQYQVLIPKEIHRRLKLLSAMKGETMQKITERVLREELEKEGV